MTFINSESEYVPSSPCHSSNTAYMSAQDASLVETDRLFLRLLRHKFWLDSSLATVDRAVAMLTEIADQADLGLGSRQHDSYR